MYLRESICIFHVLVIIGTITIWRHEWRHFFRAYAKFFSFPYFSCPQAGWPFNKTFLLHFLFSFNLQVRFLKHNTYKFFRLFDHFMSCHGSRLCRLASLCFRQTGLELERKWELKSPKYSEVNMNKQNINVSKPLLADLSCD